MLKLDSHQPVPRSICIGRVISEFVSDQVEEDIEKVRSWTPHVGGSAANVALGLAKLNSPVSFIGCVGDDEAGERLKSSMAAAGVDVSGVRTIADTQTGWLWTLRHPDGGRTFHAPQVSFETFADSQVTSFDIDIESFLEPAFLIPQSAHLGPERSREALYKALELTKRSGGITVFDVNYRSFAWPDLPTARSLTKQFAAKCEFVKLELTEAELLFETNSIDRLAKILSQARGILLTRGPQGCDYLIDGNVGHLPGFSAEVIDSTGAGDAFVAALVSRLTKVGMRESIEKVLATEIVQYANAAGAICVSKPGAVSGLPTAEEIESKVRSAKA